MTRTEADGHLSLSGAPIPSGGPQPSGPTPPSGDCVASGAPLPQRPASPSAASGSPGAPEPSGAPVPSGSPAAPSSSSVPSGAPVSPAGGVGGEGRSQRRREKKGGLGLTRDTRYTVEQVLDGRTLRYIKSISRAASVRKVFGAISCGKEANVYFALGEREQQQQQEGEEKEGQQQQQQQQQQQTAKESLVPFALKVYRTSILSFKDRSRYVQGDFRFEHSYSRNRNPRKMVAVWASKEFRNLMRFAAAGIACPIPVACKSNVLLMQFIGSATYKGSSSSNSNSSNNSSSSSGDVGGGTEGSDASLKREADTTDAPAETETDTDTDTSEEGTDDDAAAAARAAAAANNPQEELWCTGTFSFPFDPSRLSYSAAPRLKDLLSISRAFAAAANIRCCCSCKNCHWGCASAQTAAGFRLLYVQMVLLLRTLFHRCRSVHGDFSDYNLLYYKKYLYMIDVSQAVEKAHPQALDFLKRDCKNITHFFYRSINSSSNISSNSNNNSSNSSSKRGGCSSRDDNESCICAKDCKETRDQWDNFPPTINKSSPFYSSFPILSVRQLFEFIVRAELPEELKALHQQKLQQQQEQKQQQQQQEQQQQQFGVEGTSTDVCMQEALAEYLLSLTNSAEERNAAAEESDKELNAGSSSRRSSSRSSSRSRSSRSRSSSSSRSTSSLLEQQQVEDAVFLQSWIPSSLHDVSDLAALDRYAKGTALPYDKELLHLHDLVHNPPTRAGSSSGSGGSSGSGSGSSDSDSSSSSSGEESDSSEPEGDTNKERRRNRRRRKGKEEEDDELNVKFTGKIPEGISRKEWKKKVKEMNKERRLHKIPKHLKKKYRKKAANR